MSLVEEMFRAILKIVVNKRIVGKKDISKTSFENITVKSTVKATAILHASNTSRRLSGIGIIIMINAARRYAATPRSAFFIYLSPFICYNQILPFK